jgi:hypothetical protein
MSGDEIARLLHCQGNSVRHAMKKHGIPTRTRSEAGRLKESRRGLTLGRDRQMVTADGLSDNLPGTVKHFGGP